MKNEGWLPWVFGGDLSYEELFSGIVKKNIPFGSPS